MILYFRLLGFFYSLLYLHVESSAEDIPSTYTTVTSNVKPIPIEEKPWHTYTNSDISTTENSINGRESTTESSFKESTFQENSIVEEIYSPVPVLPTEYKIHIEVFDILDNGYFSVEEEENDGRARYNMKINEKNISCIFSVLESEGYTVEGVQCRHVGNLPDRCFCSRKFCQNYVSIRSILEYLHHSSFEKKSVDGKGKVDFYTWSSTKGQMVTEAVYYSVKQSNSVYPTIPPLYSNLQPLSFTIKGPGKIFNLSGGEIWLQYKVSQWSVTAETKEILMSTPPGIFCPFHDKKTIPNLQDQFSLTMETVIENLETIAYERQSYEAEQKLVSFTHHPHIHSGSMFLLSINGLSHPTSETFRVVHNFKTGIQYRINEETKNCTISAIPLSAMDAAPTENQHVRLRHASELIFIDPAKFIYKGTRKIRGIVADVWIAESGIRKGRYSTVEVYFSHKSWTIEVEVFNKINQIPLGITSYITDANNQNQWSSVVHTYFYEYKVGHHSWNDFDISPCISKVNRLFLKLVLQVEYNELIQYNMKFVESSVRKAIGGISGVSTLRITEIYFSTEPITGETNVWFILLEKPQFTGPVVNPRPQMPMTDAYKLMRDIIKSNNVSIKLDLQPNKKIFVTVKRGSLQTTTEQQHPISQKDSIRLLRAGYTAGSVAGLGFSMAILGTCVGIFVGFLLWKRNSTVPYHIRI